MNSIRQYLTVDVYDEPGQTDEFTTLQELLDIPWVKRWRDYQDCFHQYSVTRDNEGIIFLMGEFEKGSKWWIIGVLNSLDGLDKLPTITYGVSI